MVRAFAEHLITVQHRGRSLAAQIARRAGVAEVAAAGRQLRRSGGFQTNRWLAGLGKGRCGRPAVEVMQLGVKRALMITQMCGNAASTRQTDAPFATAAWQGERRG